MGGWKIAYLLGLLGNESCKQTRQTGCGAAPWDSSSSPKDIVEGHINPTPYATWLSENPIIRSPDLSRCGACAFLGEKV